MNTATAPIPRYGYKDFASSIVAAARRLKGSFLEISPLETESFLLVSLQPIGIAEAVDGILVGRSAALPPRLRQKVTELSDLKPNWDGEGAKTVKAHVLADVVEALKRLAQRATDFREPFLAPTFDGFVQIEWHDKKRSLEIEAVNEGWSVAGTMLGVDSKRHYFTAECERSDFGQLERFYGWFLGNELIWPSL